MLHFSKEEIESACEIAGIHDCNLVFPGLLRSRGIRGTEVLSSVFDFDTGSLNVTLRVQPNAPAERAPIGVRLDRGVRHQADWSRKHGRVGSG
jgi:hypothetical protein